MPSCPACPNVVPDGSRFCPACGTSLDADATRAPVSERPGGGDETRLPDPSSRVRVTTTPSRMASTDASGHYTAGTLLAGRYRIVGLLGKGGMGEVYRADDLTLGQPVALKFVPRDVSRDVLRLEHFLDEARAARQVAHGNVCRVYDVGETTDPSDPLASRRFLTMEYIDGEDLATSLRRIGRFPVDKGLEIARQLCAGLAAVHERGLLHRDLKPANVMLDGRGRVRLTDFGLAGEARPAAGADHVSAGTPAYMAPELLKGEPATVASDIYALGLVLYEVFTGTRAFDAGTVVELRQRQEHTRPSSLSSRVGRIDAAIEETIFRCLDPRPAQRPGSAIAVAAALPGGDPLAAALAAGETPSPAMVAAAGENLGLTVRAAVSLVGAYFVLFAAVIGLIAADGFTRHVPLDYPTDVLANKAEDLLRTFGYAQPPADRAHGFYWHTDYTQYVNRERKEADRWKPMRDGIEAGVLFWYRASDAPLVPENFSGASLANGRVSLSDPPPMRAGDRRVWLDTKGRLTRYEAVPPQLDADAGASTPGVDWDRLFVAAGLDRTRFTSVPPQWVPLAGFDVRAAWTGSHAGRPDTPLRIEAAAWRGRPVFFRVIGPWTRPERQRMAGATSGPTLANVVGLTLLLLLVAGTAGLARYNVAHARADTRGALRLAVFVAALVFLGWMLSADHASLPAEIGLGIMGASVALFSGLAAWLLYVALEPFVRRRWPHTVITWNRLLAGRFRDGLFGRDLLIGSVLGMALAVLFFSHLALGRLLGPYDPEPLTPVLLPLIGTRLVASALVSLLYDSIMGTLTIFSLIFILLLVLRRTWAAAAVALVIVALQSLGGTIHPALDVTFKVSMVGAFIFVLFRYGLVAFAVGNFVLSTVGGGFPMTADLAQWYTGPSLVVFAGLAAAAVVGFRLSIGSQKLFGGTFEP